MSKRTLDGFFQTPNKKAKVEPLASPESPAQPATSINETDDDESSEPPTTHSSYPFPAPALPSNIASSLQYSPAVDARHIHNRPHLDLLYFEPFVDRKVAQHLFRFLRDKLFFYRVKYKIKRGALETDINTPRFTTVFGVDETSKWHVESPATEAKLLDSSTSKPVDPKKYARQPRPIPDCLETLRHATEAVTGETFNFCLVNYYADGNDSISYHSDDERFLGPKPAIASFSLGSKRDFLMKPKPKPPAAANDGTGSNGKTDDKPLKLPLASGDMVLMRGETQGQWLHSIPKRKGGQGDGGRINITFRKAMVKGGSENYYQYNVGAGPPHRWDPDLRKMVEWRDV
ncbi:MAG: hypothetical protein Q9162_006167 [Coniocarpon cinnabarinum]